jgi:hypothetical protein
MKFSIPFFGKRNAASGTDAPAQESTPPSAADQPAKKPFVVPESAASMPSFSQPAELADIAMPIPAIEEKAADALDETSKAQALEANEPQPETLAADVVDAVVVDAVVVDTAAVVDAAVVDVAVPQEEAIQADVVKVNLVQAEAPVSKAEASPAPTQPVAAVSPAPAVVPSESPSEAPTQMNSMAMSQEDIIAAYKIFLKRHPENLEVVQPRVGLSGDRILLDFLSSGEFTSRPEVVQLIFALAKKLLEEQKAKSATEAGNAGVVEPANVAAADAEK